jgi:two-component system NtrC family sensor kinase
MWFYSGANNLSEAGIHPGSGIAAGVLLHIFTPFYTSKPVGEGTGLGLSISHGIIKQHNGRIEVTSEEGKGSCFSVYIPIILS